MQSIENWINKGGLRTTAIRRIRDYTFRPPDLLWSRGWSFFADYSGDLSYLYPAYPTRYCVAELKKLRGKQGIIWLRSGNYPIRDDWGDNYGIRLGDIATFARDVVGYLGGPTVLITTDGDMSIPGDLPEGVAQSILDDESIVAWYTQNYDKTLIHPKLLPVPDGVGLHLGGINRISGARGQGQRFQEATRTCLPAPQRIPRVWSDTHLRSHPGFHGDPRAVLSTALRDLSPFSFVDTPVQRIKQTEVWNKYATYQFVISLPGHGLDCTRTWEALALGACVLTVNTPLDELLSGYRVISLDIKRPEDWLVLNQSDWLHDQFQSCMEKPQVDLSWENWLSEIKLRLGRR